MEISGLTILKTDARTLTHREVLDAWEMGRSDRDADPVVWWRGKTLPNGEVMVYVLLESVRNDLIDHTSDVWLAEYLDRREKQLQAWNGAH